MVDLLIDPLFEEFIHEELIENKWWSLYLDFDIPREKLNGKYLNKMKVAFYCGATDYSLKDIARKTDVSYGLVRKWNCIDKEFNKIKAYVSKRFVDWYYFRLGVDNLKTALAA